MMTLGAYLKVTRRRQEELAAEVGVTQATISRLARGMMSPSVDLAAAIKRATSGAVDFESWVSVRPQPAGTSASNIEHSHAPTSQDS
ncbi:helix-turn-helix transcriptional regulator [Paracoccus sp. KR1-242]|uniref:helix-turn-helix transcriptional regulator n=1 Tax=Paracoccus sp. KR1-242 TaxID=3410028 RepID=UPI003C07BECE